MHILFQPYMHHIHGKKNVQTCHFRVLCLVIVDIIGWEGLRIHVRKLQHYKLTLIKSRKQPEVAYPLCKGNVRLPPFPCSCIKKLPTKKYFYQLYRIILPPHITNFQKSESANVIIDSMPCHPCLSGLQQFVAKCQNLVPKQLLVHHSTMSRTIKLEKAYTS